MLASAKRNREQRRVWEPRWLGRARVAVSLVVFTLGGYAWFASPSRALALALLGMSVVLVATVVADWSYRDRWKIASGRD
jgi:hypothetical protein